jgi:hypothetical protein
MSISTRALIDASSSLPLTRDCLVLSLARDPSRMFGGVPDTPFIHEFLDFVSKKDFFSSRMLWKHMAAEKEV